MKLLVCARCGDVVALTPKRIRRCECGRTEGRYLEDGHHAEASGDFVAIGLNSANLVAAVRMRHTDRWQVRQEAWVIPPASATLSRDG